MDPLKSKLRRALSRLDPPDGFAERVLRRIEDEEKKKARGGTNRGRFSAWPSMMSRRPVLAGALAVLLAMVGGAHLYRRHQERLRTEMAKEQLLMALQITGTELVRVRQILLQPPSDATESRR
jgi:hypothetical protein